MLVKIVQLFLLLLFLFSFFFLGGGRGHFWQCWGRLTAYYRHGNPCLVSARPLFVCSCTVRDSKKRIPLKICILSCFVWLKGVLFDRLCVLCSSAMFSITVDRLCHVWPVLSMFMVIQSVYLPVFQVVFFLLLVVCSTHGEKEGGK